MNTVFQGLYDKAQEIPNKEDRYDFYVNYSIDYLRERVEHMIINAGDIDETKEMVRRIEGALDEIAGIE